MVLELNDPAQVRVETRKFGRGGHEVLVADQFLRHPEAVRAEALKLDYTQPKLAYPGVISEPDWDYSEFLAALGELWGQNIGRSAMDLRFSMVTMRGEELGPWQCMPHVDGAKAAGLIYLNLPDQCSGGTAFFRHRASGLECIPHSLPPEKMRELERQGYGSVREWLEAILRPPARPQGYITGSNEDWEQIGLVEMKFNRLVLYSGQIFHSGLFAEDDFGQSADQRRLTFNFFVRRL